MPIEWQWRRYADLSSLEIYTIFAARQAVFIVEQNSPYLDMDGKDFDAWHLIAWSGKEVAAYLLELGADPAAKDGEDNTPAQLAALWKRHDLAAWLRSYEGGASGAGSPHQV